MSSIEKQLEAKEFNGETSKIEETISHKKTDSKLCKAAGALFIAIGTIGTIYTILSSKHELGKITFPNVVFSVSGIAIPCGIVGAGAAIAGKWGKEEIEELEQQLAQAGANEILLRR